MENSFKKYLLFWFGGSVSQLGSAMTSFALILWTYTQTKSAMAVLLQLPALHSGQPVCRRFCGPAPQENHYARGGFHRGRLFIFCPAVLAVRGTENPVHLCG